MSLVLLAVSAASAQEQIAAARELYAAAAYEDALDALGKARESFGPAIAVTDVEVLRAFCLLALKRETEAREAIEGVVTERPMYMPGEEEASPRIRTAFRDVRRKLLPSVARQLYQSARQDYEQKNLVSAAAKFGDLVRVLEDPDVAQDATLADLRMLADGFRALSAAAADVATASNSGPAASAVPASARPVGNGGSAAPGATAGAAPGLPNLAITPPVAINQQLPPWRGDLFGKGGPYSGAVDLLIDEQGRVESVSLRESVHPMYDAELLRVARTWTYQPARRGDQAIKSQKTLVVRLSPR